MNPKLARILARFAASAAFSLLALSAARADLIANGDFSASTDLAGWTAEFTIIGEPTHNYAQLGTDGEPRRTLSQTFSLPALPATLGFDFSFHTTASSVGDIPGGVFPDSFAASLITTGGDFLDILVVDLAGADA